MKFNCIYNITSKIQIKIYYKLIIKTRDIHKNQRIQQYKHSLSLTVKIPVPVVEKFFMLHSDVRSFEYRGNIIYYLLAAKDFLPSPNIFSHINNRQAKKKGI